ncbi:hypothetical protein Cadr_000017779 [Camelus dromedarius]|uniref:Uncharacterized protein n=1 Tax=Camelus dromedarius TaxID=9838 RepID=A0A5N4D778_CAMDR|nr:hypothetical protein Cadr_000017779 [Camelus dromedarius]
MEPPLRDLKLQEAQTCGRGAGRRPEARPAPELAGAWGLSLKKRGDEAEQQRHQGGAGRRSTRTEMP